MKAVFVSLFTLAASALAGPIGSVGVLVARDQTVTISTLTETVHSYTSSINTTITSVAENPTEVERTAAIQAIAPKVEGLTDAIHAAVKASASSGFLDVDTSDLLTTVEQLVSEIVYTVKGVVDKLGLVDGLLVVLKPLFIVLGSLVRVLDTVVAGLLVDVEGILNTVLSTVAGLLTTLL